MDQSLKIQMDIKNNAQDLQNYVLDLKNWEKEMKKKEAELSTKKQIIKDIPPPRNKIKRSKPTSEKTLVKSKTQKISGYDYSAWDKYDVDKACAELDDNDSQNEIDEKVILNETDEETKSEEEEEENVNEKLSLIDQAFYEKELGNQFFKKEEWNNAVKCYTNAINLDPKNAVYYANRALCFLKLKNFRSAEVDSTTAIQLDKKYVKAYQRRGFARIELGQHLEAKADFEEVLKIEPHNSLMKLHLNKINEQINKEAVVPRPKSIFNHKNIFKSEVKEPLERRNEHSEMKPSKENKQEIKKYKNSEKILDHVEGLNKDEIMTLQSRMGDGDKVVLGQQNVVETSVFNSLPDFCKIIHPVQKPPHTRSKKPLKKIEITEKEANRQGTVITDDRKSSITKENKLLTKKPESLNSNKYEPDFSEFQKLILEVPKTSIQFQNCWRYIKRKPEEAYKYLERVSEKLPYIFENALESNLFSDLLAFLAMYQIEQSVTYKILLNLSNVKRFSSMTLFMSKEDKTNIRKCITELRKIKSKKEILELTQKYELEMDV